MRKTFYGWWITAACFCTFGIAVGIPYYSLPFFYDYFEQAPAQGGFGWSRSHMMLGFPLAALCTIWVGPLVAHRWSPRRLILLGTAVTAAAFLGFSRMQGQLWIYYGLWLLYMVGYICSGPIPHQVLVSYWFRKQRGKAMGIMYVGVGLCGAISAKYIARPLTEALGFQAALAIMGAMLFLAWPIVLGVVRDRPSDMGLFPDNNSSGDVRNGQESHGFGHLLRKRAFWLLLAGSVCSIGAIGAVNQHMKLIFKDQGFTSQEALNYAFSEALFVIMISSISGRLVVGWMADRFSKKWLTLAMYLLVALSIPLPLLVKPPHTPYLFALIFGLSMGADYMLIPLVAAEYFGAGSLARVMGVILPADMIGLTWLPYAVSMLREQQGDYRWALGMVFALALLGAALIALLPSGGRKGNFLLLPFARVH